MIKELTTKMISDEEVRIEILDIFEDLIKSNTEIILEKMLDVLSLFLIKNKIQMKILYL